MAERVRAERGSTGSPESVEEMLPEALPPAAAAALVFVAAGAVLMLEILAVRLLAPYVGLTLETTTSIIGAALAGIALGAAVGGYFADRTNTRLLVVGLLIGGGLLALLTVPIVRWLGPGARGDGDLAALGITLIALVPAAATLSAVSPAVAHLQLHDLRASGTVVGSLSAWATAGALLGTFGTGFVLVPLIPVGVAVLCIGVTLVLVGVTLGAVSKLMPATGVAGILFAAAAVGTLSPTLNSPCDEESDYHCMSLVAESGGYHLLLDSEYNSFVDPGKPQHLEYSYVRWIADTIESTSPPKAPLDVVFVGGGGFTLPRWLEATRPGSTAHVLEVDGELVDFVEERLGLRTSEQLRVSVGDARVGILDIPADSADVVVGDAFSGLTVPWHLTTEEWVDEVRRVLRPGGVYALNMIDLEPLELLKAETATLLAAFADVRLVSLPNEEGEPAGGNTVLLASDRPLPRRAGSIAKGAVTYDRVATESFVEDAEPLRDDYAPVDQLLTIE